MRLSLNDYNSILKYYDIDSSGMKNKDIKQEAAKILAEKICRCIKWVDKYKSPGDKHKSPGDKHKSRGEKYKSPGDKYKSPGDKRNNSETKAIAVCKNSVLTKKNLKISKFNCKKSAKFLPNKSGKNILSKTKHKLRLLRRKLIEFKV